MKIDLVPCEGPIAREINGLTKLQAAMPPTWFAYANREIAVGNRSAAEIDLLIVGDDRIYLVDLKDWHGTLENDRGRWLQNGLPRGRSAVRKVRENAKKIAGYFRGRLPPRVGNIFVEGLVVVTGDLDYSSLPADERMGILKLDEFGSVSDPKNRERLLERVSRAKDSAHLTDFKTEFDLLMRISSAVKPRVFRPFGYDLGKSPESVHRSDLYREFFGTTQTGDRGIIRQWDFTKLPIEMQELNARTEILARETQVRDHLALHSAYFEADEWALNRVGVDDDLELFEHPRALTRAAAYIGKAVETVGYLDRLDKLKALVATIAEMHKLGCAHTDLTPYSVWLGAGTRHKLSNLVAARIPSRKTLGPQRYLFVNESGSGEAIDPVQMDVLSLAKIGLSLLTASSSSGDSPLASICQFLESAGQPNRVASAGDLLASLNKLDPRTRTGVAAMQELATRVVSATNPYIAYTPTGAVQARGDQLTYSSVSNGKPVVVKIWNSVSNSSSTERIFAALPGFLKARAVLEGRDRVFAEVHDCGIGQGASFVVVEFVEGESLGSKKLSSSEAADLCSGLVRELASAHDSGLAHGDLSPENVIVIKDEGGARPVFIDFIRIDLGPSDYTPGYSPLVECDDFQRDAFGMGKIAFGLLSSHVEEDAICRRACELIEGELEDGWRDPSLFLAKLKASLLPVESIIEAKCIVQLPMVTLASAMDLESDGGCYYLKYVPPKSGDQGTLIINGLHHALKLPVQPDGTVAMTHGRLGSVEPLLLGRLRSFTPRGAILNSIRLQLLPLGSDNDLSDAMAQVANWLRQARQPSEGLLQRTRLPSGSIARRPRDRREAWDIFAQAESEARFEVRITGAPSQDAETLVFPVAPWQVPDDIASPRTVYRMNRHGDEVEMGNLAFTRSGESEIAVEGVSLQDFPSSSLPILIIRDRRNESAREKKVAAARRLAVDSGARIGLLAEFDALASRQSLRPSFGHINHVSEEDLRIYGLNGDQRTAVLGALNGSGVFLLQGPPGTGKTKTIAALVHTIATKLGSRRILVASQTHEAVNNAASKIADTFNSLGTPLDLVRVGNEDDVADELLGVHTAALRRDFVSLFIAEADARLRPIGREIGLDDSVIDLLLALHRSVIEPLERAMSWDKNANLQRASIRPQELRRFALDGLKESFPEAEDLDVSVGGARTQLASLVASAGRAASPDQCQRFLDVISAASDALRRLSGGASDGPFGEFLVKTRAIACGTCVGIGSAAFKLADKVFDWVIVDEAARCTPTELAVAIQSGKRIVLVGDHLQLPPFIGSEVRAALQRILDAKDVSAWCKSDFEEMFSEVNDSHCASLWEQYRMIEPISRIVSDLAYDGKLESNRSESISWAQRLPYVGQAAVSLVDTNHFGPSESQRQGSKSYQNQQEASWIVHWLKDVISDSSLLSDLISATEQDDQAAVGVICAYSSQVELLRERIYEEGIEDACSQFLKVGTVDSYQGRENVVVIVSLVRSNPSHTVGHVQLFQRINVALSRARERLVIVGDSATWLDQTNEGFLASQAWSYISKRADGTKYQVLALGEGVTHE